MFCRVAKRKAIGEQLGDKRYRTSDKDFGFCFFFKLWVKEDTPGRCEQRNGRMVLICMQYEKLHYEGEKAEAETQETIILSELSQTFYDFIKITFSNLGSLGI